MAEKDKQEEARYFIATSTSLAEYGNANGSDKAEAEQLLAEASSEVGELVVIKGVMVRPKFVL